MQFYLAWNVPTGRTTGLLILLDFSPHIPKLPSSSILDAESRPISRDHAPHCATALPPNSGDCCVGENAVGIEGENADAKSSHARISQSCAISTRCPDFRGDHWHASETASRACEANFVQ